MCGVVHWRPGGGMHRLAGYCGVHATLHQRLRGAAAVERLVVSGSAICCQCAAAATDTRSRGPRCVSPAAGGKLHRNVGCSTSWRAALENVLLGGLSLGYTMVPRELWFCPGWFKFGRIAAKIGRFWANCWRIWSSSG